MPLPQKILIVEDEVITQRYLLDILNHYGIQDISCFDNGQDTIKFLEKNPCEMILMDINIKGTIDGIMLTKEILKHHSIPIVFITAYNDKNTLKEAIDLAPFGFIVKPFIPDTIEATLKVAYARFLSHKAVLNNIIQEEDSNIISINKRYYFKKDINMIFYNNKIVKLTAKQSDLIEILIKNINHVVSFDTITYSIWKDETPSGSSLRNLVYSVKKDLPEFPIISYSKSGYCLKTTK